MFDKNRLRARTPPILSTLLFLLQAGFLWYGLQGVALSQTKDPGPIIIRQGDAYLLPIQVTDGNDLPKVVFGEKSIPVFQVGSGSGYAALIGIDLDQKPSKYDLVIEGSAPPDSRVVEVVPAHFGVQELTLPDDQVFLDQPTLDRVEKEKNEMLAAMKPVSPEKLWEGEFIYPVKGQSSGRFGFRRIINGEARSPHTGEDFSVPEGTPVKATNSGRVVLVGYYFFTGNSVFIDHGLGCYSMYFHLKEAGVKKGQSVKTGDIIGKVGATGRATGPHLHWGIRLNGARVNPISIVDLHPGEGAGSTP